jgi:hypothetical protein
MIYIGWVVCFSFWGFRGCLVRRFFITMLGGNYFLDLSLVVVGVLAEHPLGCNAFLGFLMGYLFGDVAFYKLLLIEPFGAIFVYLSLMTIPKTFELPFFIIRY